VTDEHGLIEIEPFRRALRTKDRRCRNTAIIDDAVVLDELDLIVSFNVIDLDWLTRKPSRMPSRAV